MSSTKTIDGIAYREVLPAGSNGSAPAALFLHGYPTSSYLWRNVLPEVAAAGYRAIAPDLPGFGDSPPDLPGTWERQVANVERFRQALGLEQVVLGVHDWGGLIGLRWACEHPDAVGALVISATGFFADGKWHGMAQAMGDSSGRAAILFGPERSGLETDDVALANAIVTVPINPEFGSLNLAQAVILLAYEWSRTQALSQPTVKDLEPPSTHGELEGMIAQLDAALVAKGYFHPPERTQATRNTLRTIFTKPGWSTREIQALRGVIRALSEPARP